MNIPSLLPPGEFLARRFDESYNRFIDEIRRRMKRGDRKLLLYSRLARGELVLALAVGAMVSYFGFVFAVLLLLCFYPLAALGDPHALRKVYGRLARGLGYRGSFLINLDVLYWFVIGWVVGAIL